MVQAADFARNVVRKSISLCHLHILAKDRLIFLLAGCLFSDIVSDRERTIAEVCLSFVANGEAVNSEVAATDRTVWPVDCRRHFSLFDRSSRKIRTTVNFPDPVIFIANKSKIVKSEDLQRVIPALQYQIDEQFYPLWGWRADLMVLTDVAEKHGMKVIIHDRSSKAGILGYHFKGGLPTTYIFAKDDITDSGEYSSTLSHELLEMIADPDVNLYARGPVKLKDDGRPRMGWVGYEICDPVEGNLYDIGGVKVSNFVTPEYFEAEHKRRSVKFDFLHVLDRPFEVADGGYLDVLVNSRWHTIWGPKANPKRIRHRLQARKRL